MLFRSLPSGADFALLGLALLHARRGLAVGGKTGSGLGMSHLEIEKIRYFDSRRSHGLREYLTKAENDGYEDMGTEQLHNLLGDELKLYLDLHVAEEAVHA